MGQREADQQRPDKKSRKDVGERIKKKRRNRFKTFAKYSATPWAGLCRTWRAVCIALSSNDAFICRPFFHAVVGAVLRTLPESPTHSSVRPGQP